MSQSVAIEENPPVDNVNLLEQAEVQDRSKYSLVHFFHRTVRNAFLLPLSRQPQPPFIRESQEYAKQVLAGLKGELSPDNPLSKISQFFTFSDHPITIPSKHGGVTFHTRIIESKHAVNGKKLRLILLSLNGNEVVQGSRTLSWDPLHVNEISGGILEVLKAYQGRFNVDSLMCFSLGGVTLDGLKKLSNEESNWLPKTVIWNRVLPSMEKAVNQKFYFPLNLVFNQVIGLLGLDASPEKELTHFFSRIQSSGAPMKDRKVVVIHARHDTYFSGSNGPSPQFEQNLAQTGVSTSFQEFSAPFLKKEAHHAMPLNLLSKDFPHPYTLSLPKAKTGNLAEWLTEKVFKDVPKTEAFHTSVIVGGSLDWLDSVTVLHALPLLSAYIQNAEVD